MSDEETLEEVSKFIEQYTARRTKEAVRQVELERLGKGCGCMKCRRQAVQDVNDWIAWYCAEDEQLANYRDSIMYRIDRKGKIVQGLPPTPKGNAQVFGGNDE